jgi:hypothetical protein
MRFHRRQTARLPEGSERIAPPSPATAAPWTDGIHKEMLMIRSTRPVFHRQAPVMLAAAAFAAAAAAPALAHIGYSNRSFGTITASGSSITNQTVSSGFGWADATDADWGDSHRGRFFRFTVASGTSVRVTVQRNRSGTGTPGTFLPGISLFSGLAQLSPEAAAHDSAALSVTSRPGGTEGSFRALADWSIGNDPTYVTAGDPASGILIPARLANFTYIGHRADGTAANYGAAVGILGDGVADGFVTATFADLAPGDYSLFVGGANDGLQLTETGPTFPTYGVDVTVFAVPEPATGVLVVIAGGAAGWTTLRRRRTTGARASSCVVRDTVP